MNDNTAFELYKLARQDQINFLNLHRQYSQQYFVLITTLFGISLGVLYHFRDNPWIMIALIFGPILGVLLSINAIKACDRFYQRFLENITIQAKLEPIIDVKKVRTILSKEDNIMAFTEDDYLIPERWIKARSCPTSKEFVKTHKRRGVNKYIFLSFLVLIIANGLLFLVNIYWVLKYLNFFNLL